MKDALKGAFLLLAGWTMLALMVIYSPFANTVSVSFSTYTLSGETLEQINQTYILLSPFLSIFLVSLLNRFVIKAPTETLIRIQALYILSMIVLVIYTLTTSSWSWY